MQIFSILNMCITHSANSSHRKHDKHNHYNLSKSFVLLPGKSFSGDFLHKEASMLNRTYTQLPKYNEALNQQIDDSITSPVSEKMAHVSDDDVILGLNKSTDATEVLKFIETQIDTNKLKNITSGGIVSCNKFCDTFSKDIMLKLQSNIKLFDVVEFRSDNEQYINTVCNLIKETFSMSDKSNNEILELIYVALNANPNLETIIKNLTNPNSLESRLLFNEEMKKFQSENQNSRKN